MKEIKIGLSEERVKDLVELVKASIKLSPRQRFEILREAQERVMRVHGCCSLAEVERLSEKAEKIAREI
ncbi:hypothetical protein AKJ58_00270 [candidate division MSBL1 archaeon SCGC-AAA385D11]|nr:hypothetical protein AKJ58_00270 [candidate division MSBL1 archaeon SCGC-AAA385D11]